ncbi:hypothetical protein LCGC14_1290210, partial [marine sediment metagenome]
MVECSDKLKEVQNALKKELRGETDGAERYKLLADILSNQGEKDYADTILLIHQAEVMHKKALELFEQLGSKEGMANQYGNLGNVYRTREELDTAEQMYKKVLAIDEELGRKESIATAYGNLGLVYSHRGDPDRAEEMHLKSLEIEKQLGRTEGMGQDYGNLGIV